MEWNLHAIAAFIQKNDFIFPSLALCCPLFCRIPSNFFFLLPFIRKANGLKCNMARVAVEWWALFTSTSRWHGNVHHPTLYSLCAHTHTHTFALLCTAGTGDAGNHRASAISSHVFITARYNNTCILVFVSAADTRYSSVYTNLRSSILFSEFSAVKIRFIRKKEKCLHSVGIFVQFQFFLKHSSYKWIWCRRYASGPWQFSAEFFAANGLFAVVEFALGYNYAGLFSEFLVPFVVTYLFSMFVPHRAIQPFPSLSHTVIG